MLDLDDNDNEAGLTSINILHRAETVFTHVTVSKLNDIA